ncbi:MAG TPA: hypothetical protein VEQ40_14090 [Pyrinomonadaceae bacterium]|nr:hypothetical protein [Pyrinomonadaceae bacterium]
MHNCRRTESQLVDLLFDDLDAEHKLRLLTEIENCASCMGQYLSFSETLLVFDRTAQAPLPPESYWPLYNAALRNRLQAPAQTPSAEKVLSVPFWKRLLTMKLPIPAPIAAALIIGLIISSALALKPAPTAPVVAPSMPPIENVRIVEVPVVKEKIVTRTIYVERKHAAERRTRPPSLVAARTTEPNDSAIADSKHEDEPGFFTRANLKGFQPADDMKLRVIKRNNTNDK